MMFDIDPCVFEFLSVAKDLYDSGLLDKVSKSIGNMEVCEDYYSLTWEGIYLVFECFRQYYKEDTGIDTMVFFDPVITSFYNLCAFYEEKCGVSRDNNIFRQDGEKEVYQCFCLDSYDYTVLLYDGSRGRPRLVILSGEEFYGHTELPGVLSEVKSTFEHRCEKLKTAIATEMPGTALLEYKEKEAA